MARKVVVRCIHIGAGNALTGDGLVLTLEDDQRIVSLDHEGGSVYVYIEQPAAGSMAPWRDRESNVRSRMTADDCIRLVRQGIKVDPRIVFMLAQAELSATDVVDSPTLTTDQAIGAET